MPQSSANTTKSSVVVMVVEDEEVIRTVASEFMADAGFEVLLPWRGVDQQPANPHEGHMK